MMVDEICRLFIKGRELPKPDSGLCSSFFHFPVVPGRKICYNIDK